MGKLIDAEKLIEIFKASMNTAKETFDIDLICEAIDFAPIAYDVDAVVEQLEDYLFNKYCVEGNPKIYEIVKGGGLHE